MGDGAFEDAPRQGEFGHNADGSTTDDPIEAGWKAMSTVPVVKQGLAAFQYWDKAGPSIERIFDGEATFDDFFTVFDESLTMAVNFVETLEIGMDVVGVMVGGPGALLGTAVSTLVSVGLNFVVELFQPVQDLFGMLTGNPDRIRTSMAMWEALATGLEPIGEELVTQAERLGEAWKDDGADAAGARLVEGNDVITVAMGLAQGVAGALDFCAATFEKVQSFLITRAADIAGFLVSLLPRAAMGPKEWILLAVDLALVATRIQLELIQIGINLGRAMGALCGLMEGAEAAAEEMNPYIDRMSATS